MLSEHYGVFCAVIASSLLSNNNTNESHCAIRASYRSLASGESSSFSRFQLLQLWRKAITALQSHLTGTAAAETTQNTHNDTVSRSMMMKQHQLCLIIDSYSLDWCFVIGIKSGPWTTYKRGKVWRTTQYWFNCQYYYSQMSTKQNQNLTYKT